MAKTFEGWDENVWHEWELRLGKLSVEQLSTLAKAVGVDFSTPDPGRTKEDYILILDEADPVVLEQQYQIIVRD